MNETDAAWCAEDLKKIREGAVTYFGIMLKKLPLDLWIFQEIITQRKPEVIIEIGNLHGGTTLFLAHLLDQLGGGKVVACDHNHEPFHFRAARHPRIRRITGDVGDPATVQRIKDSVDGHSCMVIHDAQHRKDPVLRDLRNLSPLVTKGQYFVVEDTLLDVAGWKPGGPLEAVKAFMLGNEDFHMDRSRERYSLTWNPQGYLERVR